jgi:hypothetical protein
MKRPPTAEPMVLMEYYERERAYQASYKFKAYPLGCHLLIIILNIFNFSPRFKYGYQANAQYEHLLSILTSREGRKGR